MKRVLATLVGAGATVMVAAGTAFAQSGDYPIISPSVTTSVEGNSGGAGTAFTGAGGTIQPATLAIAVLVLLGLTALFIARRRAARLAG
jgi:hypothetical protein